MKKKIDEEVKDTCMGPDCNVRMARPKGSTRWFCSFECACYAGAFHVRYGFVPDDPSKVEIILSGHGSIETFALDRSYRERYECLCKEGRTDKRWNAWILPLECQACETASYGDDHFICGWTKEMLESENKPYFLEDHTSIKVRWAQPD